MPVYEYIGLLLSICLVFFSLLVNMMLNRKHYALEMIREWNKQTAEDKITLEKTLPGLYENCSAMKLDEDILLKIYESPYSHTNPENKKLTNVKGAIVRLLNYFEFVSSAYLNHAVDKKIVQKSFFGTMFRYYCILNPYIRIEIEKTGRNPWEPFSEFIKITLRKNKHHKYWESCLLIDTNDEITCNKNSNIHLI